MHPEADPALLCSSYRQMLMPVNRGEAAVINSEGVGNIASEDGIVAVWFQYGYQLIEVPLTLEEIASACTDEKIDLADGIRTFGARLDSNDYTWFRKYDPRQG